MKQRALKYLCLLAMLLTLPVTATAQQRLGEGRRSDSSASDRERERKPEGRPAPRTATPTPRQPSWEQKTTPWWERQGPPWWEGGATPSRSRTDRTDHDRNDDYRYRGRRNNFGSGVIYVVPSSPYFDNTPSTSTVVTPPAPAIKRPEPEPPPPPPAVGFLTLDVEPRALLQIYVDDVFIGTPADLGNELRLMPGTRRIELRAKGYKPISFSAEIVENRSISFAGTLERDPSAPVEPAVVRPPAATGSNTMYMIQGCYLGNIAPKAAELRPGCDITRMITFKP